MTENIYMKVEHFYGTLGAALIKKGLQIGQFLASQGFDEMPEIDVYAFDFIRLQFPKGSDAAFALKMFFPTVSEQEIGPAIEQARVERHAAHQREVELRKRAEPISFNRRVVTKTGTVKFEPIIAEAIKLDL